MMAEQYVLCYAGVCPYLMIAITTIHLIKQEVYLKPSLGLLGLPTLIYNFISP